MTIDSVKCGPALPEWSSTHAFVCAVQVTSVSALDSQVSFSLREALVQESTDTLDHMTLYVMPLTTDTILASTIICTSGSINACASLAQFSNQWGELSTKTNNIPSRPSKNVPQPLF